MQKVGGALRVSTLREHDGLRGELVSRVHISCNSGGKRCKEAEEDCGNINSSQTETNTPE